MLFQQWSECELWYHPSPCALDSGHSFTSCPWLRDSAECAETELSLTGEGESSKADWQRGFSKLTSKRNMHVLTFPCLPTGHCFRSLLFQPFAEKHASLEGSCCVHLMDYSARTVKFAKLRLVVKCREEEREDTWWTLLRMDGNSFHSLDNLLWTAGLFVPARESCLKCSDP